MNKLSDIGYVTVGIWIVLSLGLLIIIHDMVWPFLKWKYILWKGKRILKRALKKEPDDPNLKGALGCVEQLNKDLKFGEPTFTDED